MTERRFLVTKEEDTFLLGRFDGEPFSGAYLTPEYLERLRQVRSAVAARLDALSASEMSDALKNLLGIVDRLTSSHSAQMKVEIPGANAADREELARVERELSELAKQLGDYPKGPNGPKNR